MEQDYEVIQVLGEGAFGKVYKARHRRSNDLVAVKEIKTGSKSWDEARKDTELQALRALRSQFIVRLHEVIRNKSDGRFFYVFEFIDSDLCRLLKQHQSGLDEARAIGLAQQLFTGIHHMHQHGFFHRDLKPENVLFETSEETIRICDLGQARSLRARPPFTDYVGTRWYRAPECLLRDKGYSSPVDVWAGGLIFAELIRGSPLFTGSSSIDQIYKVIKVLGTPSSDWPEFAKLAQAARLRTPSTGHCGLKGVLPPLSEGTVAALENMMALNPRRRPTAGHCLGLVVFKGLPPLDAGVPRPSSQCEGSPEEEHRPSENGGGQLQRSQDASQNADSPARTPLPHPATPAPTMDHGAQKSVPSSSVNDTQFSTVSQPNTAKNENDMDIDAELAIYEKELGITPKDWDVSNGKKGPVLIPLCRKGDRIAIEKHLQTNWHKKEALIEEVDVEGNTPLHAAVEAAKNAFATVQCLLEQGAKANAVNHIRAAPLHYVCLRKDKHRIVANILLENGAEINKQTYNGKTALHFACEKNLDELVEALCLYGADPNLVDTEGNTPMHAVLEKKESRDAVKRQVLDTLLRYKAKPTIPNAESIVPCHLACRNGYVRSLQLLVERFPSAGPMQALTARQETGLHLACIGGHHEVVKVMLQVCPGCVDMVDLEGNTALHKCAQLGSLECAVLLLKVGANGSLRNNVKKTAHDLAKQSKTDLTNTHNPELVEVLQDAKKNRTCRQS